MDKGLNIYILYDEVDNSAQSSRSNGKWADDFLGKIQYAAEELIGKPLHIKSIDEFDPELKTDGVAYVLIVILSSQSRGSKNIDHYVESFHNAFIGSSGECRYKIIKILKEPIKYFDQPPLIRDLAPFEFFTDSEGSQKGFGKTAGNQSPNNYLIHVTSLIYQVLEFANRGEDNNNAPAVYLSNCGKDLYANRQFLQMELLRAGYRVFPDKTYPDDPDKAKDLIVNDINQCLLSIHLIGRETEDPLYQSFTLSQIQFQAANSNVYPSFRKLIWTFPEKDAMDDRRNSFLELVKRDSENKENTDILQSNLEDLKESIISLLLKSTTNGNNEPPDVDQFGRPVVYVIYDYRDRINGEKLASLFRKKKYDVLFPEFNLDFAQCRRIHNENLIRFDVAVILYGGSDDKWLRMKLMELMKSPGYGRKKPVMIALLAMESIPDLNNGLELKVQLFEKINAVDVDEIVRSAKNLPVARTLA
jgi:hypothetical protein